MHPKALAKESRPIAKEGKSDQNNTYNNVEGIETPEEDRIQSSVSTKTGLSSVLRDDWQRVCVAALRRRQTKAGDGHRAGVGVFERLQRKERNRMKRKASVSHDDAIIRRLRKDPDFAAEYLKAALEDEDEPRVLLIALRHLAQAQGIAKVAKAAGIERESLYRALSVHGNPRLSTLVAVTKAIGLRLTVEAAQ
jgi:probable addiction module antidote protein